MARERMELKDDALEKVAGGAWNYNWNNKGAVFTSDEFTGKYQISLENHEAAKAYLLLDHPGMNDQQIADYLVENFGAVFKA